LLIHVKEPIPEEFFLRTMGELERLAVLVPRLPIGICVPAIEFDAALAQSTRTTALAREGEIRLIGVSSDELTDRLRKAGVPEPLTVIEQLLLRGVPAVLLDRKGDLCRYADPEAWAEAELDADRMTRR
jgi:hypothetical protein